MILGGAIYVDVCSTLVQYCTFINNVAKFGGSLLVSSNDLNVNNNEFYFSILPSQQMLGAILFVNGTFMGYTSSNNQYYVPSSSNLFAFYDAYKQMISKENYFLIPSSSNDNVPQYPSILLLGNSDVTFFDCSFNLIQLNLSSSSPLNLFGIFSQSTSNANSVSLSVIQTSIYANNTLSSQSDELLQNIIVHYSGLSTSFLSSSRIFFSDE